MRLIDFHKSLKAKDEIRVVKIDENNTDPASRNTISETGIICRELDDDFTNDYRVELDREINGTKVWYYQESELERI